MTRYSPPYALLPTLSARCRHDASRDTNESTQAHLTLPHGGCPSRLPCRRRALAPRASLGRAGLDGSRRLCGLAGPEPGGARRASQAAHCRPLCQVVCALSVRLLLGRSTIGTVKRAVMRGVLADNPTPGGSAETTSSMTPSTYNHQHTTMLRVFAFWPSSTRLRRVAAHRPTANAWSQRFPSCAPCLAQRSSVPTSTVSSNGREPVLPA
jgi:hypothetical protein